MTQAKAEATQLGRGSTHHPIKKTESLVHSPPSFGTEKKERSKNERGSSPQKGRRRRRRKNERRGVGVGDANTEIIAV